MVGDQNLQVIQQKDGSLGLIEHPGNNRLVLDQNRGVDQSTIFKFKSEMGARNEVTDQVNRLNISFLTYLKGRTSASFA